MINSVPGNLEFSEIPPLKKMREAFGNLERSEILPLKKLREVFGNQ